MEIRKNQRFRCITNMFSKDSNNILFTAGKEYISDSEGTITDNLGCCYRIVKPEHLNKYFIRLPIDEETSETKEDRVSHPSHYTWLKEKCGIEVIDITRHFSFDIGNALKYLLRAGHKQEEGYTTKEKQIEDLKKAIFYINDELNQLYGKTDNS